MQIEIARAFWKIGKFVAGCEKNRPKRHNFPKNQQNCSLKSQIIHVHRAKKPCKSNGAVVLFPCQASKRGQTFQSISDRILLIHVRGIHQTSKIQRQTQCILFLQAMMMPAKTPADLKFDINLRIPAQTTRRLFSANQPKPSIRISRPPVVLTVSSHTEGLYSYEDPSQ